jgi:phenylacetate-CoA ligase
MADPDPIRPAPDPEHAARAAAAIARSLREIPFYAKRGASSGTLSDTLEDVLLKAPLLFKSGLRGALPKQWVPAGRDVKAELASGEIELVETSGSTSDRTRILWDKGWWLRQEERGVRTNEVASRAMDGAEGPYREAILTTPVCGLGACHTGDLSFDERSDEHRLFLNMRADPTFWKPDDMTRMLDEIDRHETIGLESDPTYLATLARHAGRVGREIRVKGFTTLTYAMTSAAHLRPIKKVVHAPVLQLYGASEVGVLFMEGSDGKLHHCPRTTHVELLPARMPTPGAEDVALVVVTTMDRVVQPLVRFVVGDLVRVDRGGAARFTTVSPLLSMEGRIQDAIIRPDGAIVTAAAIDRALAPLDGIAQYQVNQLAPSGVDVDLVGEPSAPDSLVRDARERLTPLLEGLRVSARTVTAIAAESSGKYRLVRRHFPLDLGRYFDECQGVSL